MNILLGIRIPRIRTLTDPDPDSVIFVIDLQDGNQNLFF